MLRPRPLTYQVRSISKAKHRKTYSVGRALVTWAVIGLLSFGLGYGTAHLVPGSPDRPTAAMPVPYPPWEADTGAAAPQWPLSHYVRRSPVLSAAERHADHARHVSHLARLHRLHVRHAEHLRSIQHG